MSTIGWEFYGIKFSVFMTMLLSAIMFLLVWVETETPKNDRFAHVDSMAGDEGDD